MIKLETMMVLILLFGGIKIWKWRIGGKIHYI